MGPYLDAEEVYHCFGFRVCHGGLSFFNSFKLRHALHGRVLAKQCYGLYGTESGQFREKTMYDNSEYPVPRETKPMSEK